MRTTHSYWKNACSPNKATCLANNSYLVLAKLSDVIVCKHRRYCGQCHLTVSIDYNRCEQVIVLPDICTSLGLRETFVGRC